MSAQAGVWNFDGKPVDQIFLEGLTVAIEQSGPDGGDSYVDGSIAIVYRAFHTTHESWLEHQPYVTSHGNLITWDGRLDNRDQLIPALQEELTENQTDVAIVAAAFERWGTDCFRRIMGDWSLSLWAPYQRQLIFASDYMCIRHIFYYMKPDRVWWSTDLNPLVLVSGDKFSIDDDYISGYFANNADAHLTPYCEIRQVPPGQFVCICNGKLSVQRYWCFSPKSRVRYKTDADYEEHFRHLFRQSVRRRLRANGPVLAELSGGLDSSSIVCMADDSLAKEGLKTTRLDTLSYYDKTEPDGDDWLYFQKVEEKRGRVGAHIDISQFGDATSLEYSDFAALPGFLGAGRKIQTERAEVVRSSGYRVVLSGIGGDEFLGGVSNPSSHLADLIVQFKFPTLAKQLMAWSLVKRRPWVHLLWQAFIDLLPPSLGQYFIKQAKIEPWIDRNFAKRTRIAIRQLDVNEHFGLCLPTRRSYVASVLLLANRMSKQISTASPLEEIRYPYLDQNLIEFILSIPASQLLRPGERRSLMRRSLNGIVPLEILSRRTKQLGARTPIVALEKNLPQVEMVFRQSLSSKLGFVNGDRFLETLNAARNGKEINITKMLKTVSLEFWLRDLASRHLVNIGLARLSEGKVESVCPVA